MEPIEIKAAIAFGLTMLFIGWIISLEMRIDKPCYTGIAINGSQIVDINGDRLLFQFKCPR